MKKVVSTTILGFALIYIAATIAFNGNTFATDETPPDETIQPTQKKPIDTESKRTDKPEICPIRKTVGRIRSETIYTIYHPTFIIFQVIPLAAIIFSVFYVRNRRKAEKETDKNG